MKHEARLRTLARKHGCCKVHLIRLRCPSCEARRAEPSWTGTDAELAELARLIERARPYRHQIPTAGWCPRDGCEGQQYCETCYEAAAARARLPADLYSPEERARYDTLFGYLRWRDTPWLDGAQPPGRE